MSPHRPSPIHPPGAPEALPAPAWAPCAICWGQRRIWELRECHNGEGRVWTASACEACLGLGEVLA